MSHFERRRKSPWDSRPDLGLSAAAASHFLSEA